MHQRIETLGEHTIFKGAVFDVVDEEIRLSTGVVAHHITIRHPGAVVILPQRDDAMLLVIRQYRHSVRRELLEFPAGTLEPGEKPLDCARRELAEEAGQIANEWTHLGQLHPAPGFCSSTQHCFFAARLSPCEAKPDADELIEVVPMSSDDIEQAILSGNMTDGKSIALYTHAKLRGLL